VKAGGRKYNPNQVHEVERIVSEHSKLEGHRRFGIKWAGWDATYNTIEPETSVLDKSLIQDWDALRRVEVDLEEAKASQRATFASDLLKLKEATYCFEVSLPACSLGGVAHALLARDAERYGVELEVDDALDETEPDNWTVHCDCCDRVRAAPTPTPQAQPQPATARRHSRGRRSRPSVTRTMTWTRQGSARTMRSTRVRTRGRSTAARPACHTTSCVRIFCICTSTSHSAVCALPTLFANVMLSKCVSGGFVRSCISLFLSLQSHCKPKQS
jgi:hypothetical protein